MKPKRSSRKLALAYLYEERNRHGSPRVIVRRNGIRIQIREPYTDAPGAVQSPVFLRAYAAALEGIAAPRPPKPAEPSKKAPKPGTLGALSALYFGSVEFLKLDSTSQKTRRGIIESCLEQEHKGEVFRDCPLTKLTPAKVKLMRDGKKTPGAANNRRKWLSAMFGWAVEGSHMNGNPARDVKRVRYATDGFHTWTVEEVRQYEDFYPIGTQARLALAILLFLGVRRSDGVKIGKGHQTQAGGVRFIVRKTRWRKARTTEKPILPELREVLDATKLGKFTWLETEQGRPFTGNGFGNKMRAWCDEAKLPHCSAHGLRKAGAVIAAENGATVNQLMAIYDWETAAQAIRYTQAADRKKLTAGAMHLLASGRTPK